MCAQQTFDDLYKSRITALTRGLQTPCMPQVCDITMPEMPNPELPQRTHFPIDKGSSRDAAGRSRPSKISKAESAGSGDSG